MREVKVAAGDGLELSVARFDIENPKALIQIIHGAKEHKERYYDVAEYLNGYGFAVIVSDNRGNGHSVNEDYPLGYMDGYEHIVDDQHIITKYYKAEYPGVPMYMFGHSLGSMIARGYIQQYDGEIEKLVLSGTVNRKFGGRFGMLMADIIMLFKGKKGYSKFLIKHGDSDDVDWVCGNPQIMDAYRNDKYCFGYKYTNKAIWTIWQADVALKHCKKYKCSNPSLKILSISGSEDPCTGGDKGLEDTVRTLKRIGYSDISYKVYQGMKHEVVNETGKEEVYEDIKNFFVH